MATPDLGSTQYYKTNTNGVSGVTQVPYGGNAPYGYTPIGVDEYKAGLQAVLANPNQGNANTGNIADPVLAQKYLNELNSQTGTAAPNYRDPSFSQFNPQGQPTEANFTSQAKSVSEANKAAITKLQGAGLPLQTTTGQPNPAFGAVGTPPAPTASNGIAGTNAASTGQQAYSAATNPSQGLSMPTGVPTVFDPITGKQVSPSEAGLNAAKATGKAPQEAGVARAAVSGLTPSSPIVPDTKALEAQLAQDPGYQQLLADRAEYNNAVNQQGSLLTEYQNMINQAGIPALQTQLLNAKNIIDGTEQNIRDEISKAGGYGTESQVLALASARNKVLIQNYNNLQQTLSNAQNNVNTMIGLAKEDRANALNSIVQKLNIDEQMNSYRDKMTNAAKEGYANIVNAVGYGGLLATLHSDPNAISLAEKTLGLQPGGLEGLVQTQQNQANLATIKASGATTPFINKGGEIQNAATGQGYTTEADFLQKTGMSLADAQSKGLISNLQSPTTISQIQQMAKDYPDAGITAQDSLEQATAKLKASAIYRKQTYIAPSASQLSAGLMQGLTTAKGMGIIAGVQVPAAIANDVEDVLSGRNTLYNIRQTMGRTNAAAAYMSQMRSSIKAVDPKFDFIASDAGGKFVSSTYYQKSAAAINSVLPNIDKVVQLSDEVNRTGIASVDKLLQAGQIQIGNQKVANFHEAQKLISDEIGLALGQGTVSDMKLQLGFDVTDPSLSSEVFASNMGIIKTFIENRLQGLNEQRYSSPVTGGGGLTNGIGATNIGGNDYQSYLNAIGQ